MKKKVGIALILVVAVILIVLQSFKLSNKISTIKTNENLAATANTGEELNNQFHNVDTPSEYEVWAKDENDNDILLGIDINAWLLGENNSKMNGVAVAYGYDGAPDYAKLIVYLNPKDDNSIIKNGYIKVTGSKSNPVTQIQEDIVLTSARQRATAGGLQEVYLKDIAGGNTYPIELDFKSACNDGGYGAHRDRFSNDFVITVEGDYVVRENGEETTPIHFKKTINDRHLEWYTNFELSKIELLNKYDGDTVDVRVAKNGKMYVTFKAHSDSSGFLFDSAEYQLDNLGVTLNGNVYLPESISATGCIDYGSYNVLSIEDESPQEYWQANNSYQYVCYQEGAGTGHYECNPTSYVTLVYPKTLYNAVKAYNGEIKHTFNFTGVHRGFGNENIRYTNSSLIGRSDVPEIPEGEETAGYSYRYTSTKTTTCEVDFKNYSGEIILYDAQLTHLCKVNSEMAYESIDAKEKAKATYEEEKWADVKIPNAIKGLKFVNYNDNGSEHYLYDNNNQAIAPNLEGIKKYSGIRVRTEVVNRLGSNGWIKLYDEGSSTPFAKIIWYKDENGTQHVELDDGTPLADHYSYYEYMFSELHDNVEIETSKVVEAGRVQFNLLVDIDNAELVNKITEEQFDTAMGIIAPSEVQYKTGNNFEEGDNYQKDAIGKYEVVCLRMAATSNLTANIFKKTSYTHFIGIYPIDYSGEYISCFLNPTFIVEFPETVANVEIDFTTLACDNEDITLGEPRWNSANKVLIIPSTGSTNKRTEVTFDVTTTPNMDIIKNNTDENNDIYRIKNVVTTEYPNGQIIDVTHAKTGMYLLNDKYDVDYDGDTTEKVTAQNTQMNYKRLVGAGIAPAIVYNDDEYQQGESAKISENDAETVVTIKNRVYNYTDNVLSNVNIVGVIPKIGNKYLTSEESLNSMFDTSIISRISGESTELDNKVTIWYSTDLVSLKNAESISDIEDVCDWKSVDWVNSNNAWSQIKSYRIDFGENDIGSNELYEFSYKVRLPASDDLIRGMNSYTTAGIGFIANGVYDSTSAGTVGLSVDGTPIGVNIKKVDSEDQNKVLTNAKYVFKRKDGKKVEKYTSDEKNKTEYVDSVELNFNNSSKNYTEDLILYAGVDYTMDEIEAPDGYKKGSFLINISIDSNNNTYVVTTKKKNEATGTYEDGEYNIFSYNPSRIYNDGYKQSDGVSLKLSEEKESFDYTVNYYLKETTTKLQDSKIASAIFDSTVTAASEVIDITGYTYDSCDPSSLTISSTSDNNVINLYYTYAKYGYTVNYYLKDTTTKIHDSKEDLADYNSTITALSEVIPISGYTYDSCNPNSITISTTSANNVINLYYALAEATYDVHYYFQNDNGTYPTSPNSKLENQGPITIGNTVNRSSINTNPSTVSGAPSGNYALDDETAITSQKTDESITIAESNNIFNVYFTKQYTIVYSKGTHGTFSNDIHSNINYGTNTPAFLGNTNTQHVLGYTFTGWKENNTGDILTDSQVQARSVTKDTEYVAQWQPATVGYRVEYYYQVNGSYKTVADSSRADTGTTGETVSVLEADKIPARAGYVFDSTYSGNVLSGEVAGDGSLRLKVYFKPVYVVTYKPGTKGTFNDQIYPNIPYGTRTPTFVGEKTCEPGYYFLGWTLPTYSGLITDEEIASSAVTSNYVFTAQWQPRTDTQYKVEYYYQQNGVYPTTTNLSSSRTGTTDTTVSVTSEDKTPQIAGYVYDSTTSELVDKLSGVIAGDGSLVLKVYFKPQYTVSYEKGDHGTFTTQTTSNIDYGNNTPVFNGTPTGDVGYRFTGWNPTVANTVTGDATYVAQWEAIDVPYKINYYYQNNGSYSTTPDDSNLRIGKTGTLAQATATDMTPQRDGYIYDNGAANVIAQTIEGDGTTLLKVYFKQQFKVTYEPGLYGTFEKQTTSGIDYGTVTPGFIGEKTGRPGYEFTVWNPTVSDTVTGDVTYIAQWEAIDVPYTVEYYYEKNGVYPGEPDSRDTSRMAKTDTTVSVTNSDKTPTKTGYVYDENKSLLVNKLSDVVAGDGSTVLKVYFKEQFTVNYTKGDHGKFQDQITANIDYGTNTPAFTGDLDNHDAGYTFTGWSPVVADTVTENATYVAQWKAIDVPYKVEFFYKTNGSYPATPYATVTRMATTDTPVSLTTPTAVNDMTVLVTDNKETNADISRPKTDSNYKYDVRANNITSDDTVNGDGSTTLKVYFDEIPVNYDLDVVLKDTADRTLTKNQFTITRSGNNSAEQVMWDGKAVSDDTELEERKAIIDTYTYKIYENETPSSKYVNVLKDKYIGVTVVVSDTGAVEMSQYGIYNNDGTRIDAQDPVYSYVVPAIGTNADGYKKISFKVVNPVTFTFELKKVDTEGEAIADTGMSITSEIINDQNATHTNEIRTESMNGLNITDSGVVTGETNDAGIIKYEETWVNADTYTYEITETQTAGNQYVNILDGYKIVVTVQVSADGTLTLVRTNNRNYTIVATEAGKTVTSDLYNYVKVSVSNNSLSAIIDGTGSVNVEVENPVRFNIDLVKKDTAGNDLAGTKFSVVRDRELLFNNEEVTTDIEVREDPIDAGTYTYIISENSTATTRYENVLNNRYIQLKIKVNGDGHIDILDQGENNFKVYDRNGTEVTDIKNVLKYIEVWSEVGQTGDQKDITTVKVKVVNPVKYNVDITTATTAYDESKNINDYFLDETDVIAYWVKADEKQDVWRGEPIKAVEKLVTPVEAGDYYYFFTQSSTRNNKLVNPLENKYVVAKVTVSPDGMLSVGNVRLFRGSIGDPHTDEVVDDEAEKYFSITADNTGDISTLKILVIDPVRFTVEVNKLNTEEEQKGIEDTQITIKSAVVNEQNAVHEDEVKETAKAKDGIEINQDGQIEAVTDTDGQIKFEETWVESNESNNIADENKNFYTYEITEDRAAGAQYVNVLEGYKVIVRVYVSPDGDLKLVNADGNEYSRYTAFKYTIVDATTGEVIPQDNVAYKYVKVSIEDDTVKAIINETDMLKVDITNPVRFNMDLIKKDTAGEFLYGTKFSVNREGNDVPLFDESEVTEDIEVREDPIDAGIYTYYIRENETDKTVGNRYVNVLENKYIKLKVKVNANGVIEILDKDGTHNSDYFEVYEEGTARQIKDDDTLRYISVKSHDEDEDGVYTVDVQVINPVRYEIDIIKLDTLGNFLDGTNVSLYKQDNGENKELYRGNATDVNAIHEVEKLEVPMEAGTYIYYVKENSAKNERYVNILEGRYIKITLTVAPNGMLTAVQELYEGDLGGGTKVETGSVFDYYSVEVDNTIDLSNENNVSRLNITLINPVRFIVELDKYDTAEDPLVGATFEIESPIIGEQAYEHDNRTISGIKEDGIAENGTVTGVTEENIERSPDGSLLRARISYEETWVDANQTEDDYYTYIMKETKTPGAQYVNMLDGYQVVVKVHVDPEGNLELKEVNGRNFEIVPTGEKDVEPVTDELYRYVSIRVSNNKILATLNTEVINPVRYKIAVHQTIYGDEQVPLRDIPVEIQSEFSGSTTLVTDENGYSEMEEWAVWADTYEYRFFQLNEFMGRAVEDEFVNMFDGYYIGVDLYVPGDGDIKTISEEGDYTTVSYKIFKKEDDGSYSQVNFRDTILNDFVSVKVTKDEDNVCTLNIYFITPEKYDFRLVKTDIDTLFNMNNVQFSVTPRDANGEITLKKVDNSVKYKFDEINTKDQLTAIVDGVDGVISFKDILIERAGTYTFELEEVTPIVEGMIYKDKSENVIVKADIAIENGKYVLTNMEVLQADRYTIAENTRLIGSETQTVNTNITNERIKGSYDLVLNKFNKFTGLPLDGAVYKITVEQEGKENKVLYLSDGNVLSKNIIIPHIEEESISENGVTLLSDVRIEIPETYTIKIEELKAPDTFTKLDDVIELEITTGIQGEYDDAHYVLKEVKLKDGNHDLVSETHSMPEDEKQNINVNINNEYFDLALRQYITDVNGTEITNRAPSVNVDKLQSAEATTADYTQLKDPQRAYAGQDIIYTIEVYNEGIIDGYAEEIVEHLPIGLEFVDDEFNSEYGWRYDKQNHEVVTNILAREESEDNVIKAYDKDTQTLSSKKVQLKLRVAEDVKLKTLLTTIAEVRMSLAKDRNETVDRDSYDLISIPFGESLEKYAENQEDDDDFEKLVIEEFDLATVKYVKSVNGEVKEERKPIFALDNERANEYAEGIFNGFKYKANNELLKVQQNDVLVYGIEIFNEGSVGSYATEVRDTIPSGLVFNKDSEINKKYGWRMLDSDGNETDDVTKAKYVVTNYLAKENEAEENGNVIKAMEVSEEGIVIDSKTVEVEFIVTDPGKDSRLAENVAEVTEFIDDQGINVKDRDIEERLQENKERVYIKIFDLELEQLISRVEITNKLTGAVTEVNADEAGKLAKIDIAKSKLVNTNIKVEYTIKVKNNGETAGYATEIADYIPEGFEFSAEDNEYWSEVDGHLVYNGLANTLIGIGETKEVKLVLRWNGAAKNIGQKTNTSEIANDKDEHMKDVIDMDSTPNNLDLAEDDIDVTDMLITVKTGSTDIAISILVVMLMLGTSLGIAKYNNKRKK